MSWLWDIVLVIVGLWILVFAGIAIACGLELWRSFRDDPPPWWHPKIPDFVPDDWSGGDRTQTKPARRPRR
jgi:hypothetical protein